MALAVDQKQTSKLLPVHVPTAIIADILIRLPVLELLRCKSVCKLWCSLISDHYFIYRHVKKNLLTTINSANNEYEHHRLILLSYMHINVNTCHLRDVLRTKAVNALESDHPFRHLKKHLDLPVSIVGSCNGLLCIGFAGSYIIWNPSTRRSSERFSPRFDANVLSKWHSVYGSGFGYDESTDDYKVVEFCRLSKNGTESETETFTAHIYSLKSGNWKYFIHFPQSFIPTGKVTFSNGALHFLAGKSHIVSFDLATETYGEFSQPPYDKGPSSQLKLGALGEWLCVMCDYGGTFGDVYGSGNRGDLWVMKDYGVTNSWMKFVSIPYPIGFRRTPMDVFFVPLCILDDGKILMQLESKLVLYDLKNSSFSVIRSSDKWCNVATFVESLVSPDSLSPDSLSVSLGKQCSLYATSDTDEII